MTDEGDPPTTTPKRPSVSKITGAPQSIENLRELIAKKAALDRSFGHRSLIREFIEQQRADRRMRSSYAHILVRILIGQVVAINLFFLLLGFGEKVGFTVEAWSARIFIATVFLEIAVLVHAVSKYLFPRPSHQMLEAIERHGQLGEEGVATAKAEGRRPTRPPKTDSPAQR